MRQLGSPLEHPMLSFFSLLCEAHPYYQYLFRMTPHYGQGACWAHIWHIRGDIPPRTSFLNKFGLIRVGLEVVLATHFLLGCSWTLYRAQGPLFDLGILPLHFEFKKRIPSFTFIFFTPKIQPFFIPFSSKCLKKIKKTGELLKFRLFSLTDIFLFFF